MNTYEKFYICSEIQCDNQINDKSTFSFDKILDMTVQ